MLSVALAVALSSGGCSFAFVKGQPTVDPRAVPRCGTWRTGPYLDRAAAVLLTIATLGFLSLASGMGGMSDGDALAVAGGVGVSTAFYWASHEGFRRTAECAEVEGLAAACRAGSSEACEWLTSPAPAPRGP
jgi:hypothetical protein